MSKLLNYKLQGSGQTVVLIHGLFGSLDNLGLIARDLARDFQVLSLDLRNHGRSFHSEIHTYQAMADDIHALTESLELTDLHIIGHSMGGKVAMRYASQYPEKIKSLTVMDMAPVHYPKRKHDNVFAGLNAVINEKPQSRAIAMAILTQHIGMEGVRQFLSKSLYKSGNSLIWRFNLPAIFNNYQNILSWDNVPPCPVPVLFLKGAESDYLTAEHQSAVQSQFPNSKAHIIANTGHWLHAEKPQEVIRAIRKFLTNNT